ncbi:MAG: divergent polysaccharide deacetylase family protein [Marivibrio sp.]|uniref:divergent polysaccharide deacetylase family protein n=1 Tax=Marivibrio sp. TaxID=2039719 RepID=UPI0032ECB806
MKAPKLKLSIPKPSLAKLGGLKVLAAKAAAAPAGLLARFRKGDKAGAPADGAPAPSAEVDEDDLPSHLKPTFLEKHGRLVGVAAAYLLFFATLGGTALYLVLNEEAILEAERERRPSITIDQLRPEIVRVQEEASDEGTASTTPDGAADEEGAAESASADAASGQEAAGEEPAAEEPAEGDEVALLTPAPDPALIEESPTGPLPRIGEDGRTPWRVYSRPHNALETRPQIAVVVTEVGVSASTTEEAIALPGPVTLAFAPYARDLANQIEQARQAGHEVLLTLPMEPRDFPRSDPGPYALMTSLDSEANLERLNWILSRAVGYVGLANYQGSAFTADERALRPIMTALAERGLLYFDTREDPSSAAPQIAEIAGAPAASADLIADQELTRSAVLRKLNEAEVVAKAQGTAIVLLRPTPMAMGRLESWAADLTEKGIVLAPLSAIVRARASGA